MEHFFDLNEELSQKWPNISERIDPLPNAKEWDGVENKLPNLEGR